MGEYTKRKKVIRNIAIIGVLILAVCTLISTSISRTLIPEVETAVPQEQSITFQASMTGSVLYNNLVPVYAQGDWKIASLVYKTGDTVTMNSKALTIVTSSFQQEENSLRLALLQAQSQFDELDEYATSSSRESSEYQAAELQMEMAQDALQDYVDTHPSDGCININTQGVLSQWTVKPGDDVTKGQIIAYLVGDASRPCVQWDMTQEGGSNYQVGDSVSVDIAAQTQSDKSSVAHIKSTVSEKTWDNEKQVWRFVADLSGYEGSVLGGTSVKVTLLRTSSMPNCLVVPLASIQKDASSGNTYVYCLRSRDGLFSQEFYVVKVDVTVSLKNNLYAAVEADLSITDKVIYHTSKPLYDQSIVQVVE